MSRKIYITEAQLKHLMRVKINEEQINEENLINNFVDALNKGSYEIDGRNYEATTRRIDGTMDLLVVFDEEKDIYYYMRI